MGEKKKRFDWFHGKGRNRRGETEIRQEYNNVCSVIGDLVYRSQINTQINEGFQTEILKKHIPHLAKLSEEMRQLLARQTPTTNPAAPPVEEKTEKLPQAASLESQETQEVLTSN